MKTEELKISVTPKCDLEISVNGVHLATITRYEGGPWPILDIDGQRDVLISRPYIGGGEYGEPRLNAVPVKKKRDPQRLGVFDSWPQFGVTMTWGICTAAIFVGILILAWRLIGG